MKITISDSFFPLLEKKERYLIMVGGAGSGKSEFAPRKIFLRCMKEGGHRFLIMRKVRSRLRESVIEVMRRVLAENNVNYSWNKSERTMMFFNPSGRSNELLFEGLDDPDKIKSIKGITSMWLEETTEFTRDDFLQLDLRLREPGPLYQQIMCTFNPDEAKAPWLKEMFFDHPRADSVVHHSTVEDNPVREVREVYRKRLDELGDETYHSIYRLGKWAIPRGRIFDWDVAPLPDIKFDEIFYGGDFGYSIDPAVVVRIYRKADEFWVEELIYETGLTNPALARRMKDKGINGNDDVYFDSAEPKSIDELVNAGLNVKPSRKGPDSVRAGIDYLRSVKIRIIEESENIIRESSRYKWKTDKSGNTIPEPVKFDDHAMSAIRYGMFTHMKQAGAAAATVAWDVRPD